MGFALVATGTSRSIAADPPVLQSARVYALQRPDLLYRRLRARRRPSRTEIEVLRRVVAEYGLQVDGAVEYQGAAGRSLNVVFESSAGRKLLKQYKETVDPATVRHEHSILRYLANTGFPAPRLFANHRGETVVQAGGNCYALFDFLGGYFQYHKYFFVPPQTRTFVSASGRALAALHRALKNFDPEGYNPNGFRSRGGSRWRELDWFMERLESCRQKATSTTVRGFARWPGAFSGEAAWVEARLRRLDATLQAAGLPRLIIHGDYGPYNLFFKRGAPVLILDFELARLDWRLTDLATALPSFAWNRFGFDFKKMKYFLEGYRTNDSIDASELRFLPDVWLFLTLRRVIVFWHRYSETNAAKWLVEARRKLDLARWIARNHEPLAGCAADHRRE